MEKIGRDRRKLHKRDVMEDVASRLRGSHLVQTLTEALYEDITPSDFGRKLQVADEDFITNCASAVGDECPHNACVPNYLFTETFKEFSPGEQKQV